MNNEDGLRGPPQFNFQLSKTMSSNNQNGIAQGINYIEQSQPVYFGDQICLKADNLGSMKYMHSDGFYPACLKCIDYSNFKDDQIDIEGSIFEICNPSIYFGNKTITQQTSSGSIQTAYNKGTSSQGNSSGLATAAFFNSKNVVEALGQQQGVSTKSIIEQTINPQAGSGMVNFNNQGMNAREESRNSNNAEVPQGNELLEYIKKNNGNNSEDDLKWLGNGEETVEDQNISLSFYQNFILKHKRSHKFLYLVEEDLDHFSLILNESPSLFKISPSFKSQIVQSKIVYYQQFIYLQAVPLTPASNKDIFLVQDEVNQYVNSSTTISPGGGAFVSTKFADYSCFFGDFYFSPNQKTRFHLQPYRENSNYLNNKFKQSHQQYNSDDIKFLRYGDIVKIFHIETDSFLQYTDDTLTQFKKSEMEKLENSVVNEVVDEDENDLKQTPPSSQTKIKFGNNFRGLSGKSKEPIQIKKVQKLDQVFFQKTTDENQFNDSYTLWKLKNPNNLLDGDYIRWEDSIVLKCVNQNVFLHIQEDNNGNRQVVLKDEISDDNECYFHLTEEYHLENQGEETQNHSYNYLEHLNYIKFNSLFRIIHSSSNLTLSVKFNNDFETNRQDQEQNLSNLIQSQVQGKQNMNFNDKQQPQKQTQFSMTQSIVDKNLIPKIKQTNSQKSQSGISEKNTNLLQDSETIDESKRIVLKQNFCQGDILRFSEVDDIELIQYNYLASTLELISSAIPLIKYYALISEKKDESASKNIFQFTNPYFTEFIGLLKSAIQHQIKYLLDVDQSKDIIYDDSIFKKLKPNSEKQDLASKRGILEYSVNLLKAMWSYQSEQKIQDILQIINKDEEDQSTQSRIKVHNQSFVANGAGRRNTQIKQFKSKIDQKDEQIQLYNTFRQLSRLIYFLIITLCKNNGPISMNTFNYFTFFKNHVGYSIGATTAIISILRNNEKLLSSIHQKNYSTLFEVKETISRTLKKFSITNLQKNKEALLSANWKGKIPQKEEKKEQETTKQQKNKKNTLINIFFKKYEQIFKNTQAYWTNFLDVMNIMCICKDEALNINQLLIGQQLLANPEPLSAKNISKMFIQIECKHTSIIIKAHKKTYELSDFLKEEQKHQEQYKSPSNVYTFLIKQLELYANLCNGRNYQNKILLEDQITALALIHYITDSEIKTELRATLLNLLINLHFDSCPRKEIQRPCYSKSLNLVKINIGINSKQDRQFIKKLSQNLQKDNNDYTSQDESVIAEKPNQNQVNQKVWGAKGIELTSSFQSERSNQSNQLPSRFISEASVNPFNKNDKESENDIQNKRRQVSAEINVVTQRTKRFKSQKQNDENSEEVEIEDDEYAETENQFNLSPKSKKTDQLLNMRNIKPNLNQILHGHQKDSLQYDEANISCFIQKDSMENQQQMKQFVVTYLRQQIFTQTGSLKNDMLSYYVVKLARMMITFDYFKRTEEEFLQVIESLLVILQTQTKIPILEKLKGVYTKNKELKKNLEEQEKCKMMIIQEVLQTLLYYQQIITDGNLRQILEFMSVSLSTKHRPQNCTSKMDLDIHLKNMVETRLVHYLPKLQNVQFSNATQEEPIMRFTTNNNSMSRNKSVMNFQSSVQYFNKDYFQMVDRNSPQDLKLKDVLSFKYMGFDDMLKQNSFFNVIIKNFISVGSSNIQTSHLILKILFANFSQRQNIIKSLKKLQVITSEREFITFKYLKFLNIKLQFIAEMQELWFSGELNSSISQKSAFEEINVLMEQMNLAFFETADFDQDKEILVSRTSLDYLLKKGKLSFSRQQMMRNLNMHKNILSIIREGNVMVSNLSNPDESKSNSQEVKQMIHNLYKNCYVFLYLFVHDNRANQKILFNQFELLLQNVGETDYGQYQLMSEIIKDNKKICNSLTPEFIQKYITNLYKKGQQNNLQVLKFFENLIYDYDEPAYQNIDKFVKCLLESEEFSNFFGLKIVQSEQSFNPSNSKQSETNNDNQINKIEIFLQSESPLKKSIAAKQSSSKYIYSLPGQYEFNIPEEVIQLLSGQSGELSPSETKMDDIPFIYHQKCLEIANSILKHCINPTKFRYLFTKLININYMYKLLALDDIFVSVKKQTILFSFFKTTLMEFIRQVWLVNEKNSAKLNKNYFLIEFLKKETQKFITMKESLLLIYKEAMRARNGEEKISYLQNAFLLSPQFLQVDSNLQSRKPSQVSQADKNLLRQANSITVSADPAENQKQEQTASNQIQPQNTISNNNGNFMREINQQDNHIVQYNNNQPHEDENGEGEQVIKTYKRTSQMKFNRIVVNHSNSEDDSPSSKKVVSSLQTLKPQSQQQQQIQSDKINNQSPFVTITEEINENQNSNDSELKEPKKNYLEEIVMQTQSDYFIYLFQYLTPFVLDTFKCFIGYDSQQANVNSRADYEAFAQFAKEFAIFCQMEVSEDIFKQYKHLIVPVLLEFQDIFKMKIDFNFDAKLEISKLQQEQKKSVKFDEPKLEFKPRIIQDSRIQGIIQPLDEEFIKQRDDQKLNQEVAHISLHLLNSEYVNSQLLLEERNHLVFALRHGNRSNHLSLKMFLKKLVNFIKNAIGELENDEGIISIDDQVLIDAIQLLCDILDSCTSKEELIYMQNFLNNNDITKAMVKFFSQKYEIGPVFQSFISLGVRLIQGDNCANILIQESIYQRILVQPNIENFFSKISEVFKQEIHFQAFENMSISQKIEAECKMLKFSYNKHKKFSILKILRFLQLLIANCFSKMQCYLQQQTKSRTSYNILLLLVDLVEAYVGGRSFAQSKNKEQTSYVTDANTCDKVVMALETLILLIQGPCVDNQIELAQSKFLEIATYILKLNDSYEQFTKLYKNQKSNEAFIDEEKSIIQIISQSAQKFNNYQLSIEQFKQKLSDRQKKLIDEAYEISPLYSQCLSAIFHEDHPSNYGVWMLSQIKNKCVSCLESLMDGENKLITKRIMADFSPNLLKINLAWIYEKYKVLYGDQEYFDYDLFELQNVKQVNQTLDKIKDPEQKIRESLKQSFIIDSGFKIFRLLRFMLNQIGSNEVETYYNEVAKSQAFILQRQSKKNIFSQFYGLLTDLAKIFQSMYKLVRKREDLTQKVNQQKYTNNLDKYKQKSIQFFSKYTGQIEIIQDDKLIRISFPKYPHCFSLTNDLKYKVTNKLNLYSPHTKVESIIGYSETFIERLKFEKMFNAKLEKNYLVAILSNNLDLWKNLSYIVCIIQNFLILLHQKRTSNDSIFQFEFIGTQNKIQLFFQVTQITFASLVFFFFILKKVPLINKKTEDKILQIEKKKFSINEHTLYQNEQKADYKIKLRNLKIKTILFFNDVELVYFLVYFSLALLGMFNEFFLALLLFDIFWRFPVLLSILHAVWRPRTSIILTMSLFIICTYIFSLTAYYFFAERFDGLCDNLLTCFSVIFDYMYKNDGGITSFFSPNGPDDFVNYYGISYYLNWGSLWDFLYFFIIITLLFSIVSGIIIDTFGLLRDEEDEKKRNKKDFCLICSIDRATIDKLSPHNQGFQHHIDVEHNMWNYIFYISYIGEKNRNYFLGIEQEIYNKVRQKDTSWLPLNRSLTINQNQDTNEEIENLNKKINSMESRFTRILQQILKNTKVSNQKIQKIDQQQDLQQRNIFQNQQDNNSMLMSTRMMQSQSKKLPTPSRSVKRSNSVWIPQKQESEQIIEEEEVIKKLNTSLNSDGSHDKQQDHIHSNQLLSPSNNSNNINKTGTQNLAAQKITSIMNRCESEDDN